MHRQHVAPQSQSERARSLIHGAKRRTGAKIATFGVSALVAGQLLLPSVALASETPEPTAGKDIAVATTADPTKQTAETAVAAPNAAEPSAVKVESPSDPAIASEAAPTAALNAAEPAAAVALASESATASAPAAAPAARGATTPGGGEIKVNTTVVNHFYDLELPPAFTLVQDEAFVYDFPDAPEGFTLWRNESVHLFRIDPDTESLVKTEDTKEANVSINLASVDNHERATLVFTGGDADPLISYSLNLFHTAHIGAFADPDFSNFNNGEGTILMTRHEYYLRCVFGSNVYLIGTDTTDPEVKPEPEVKPDPEVKPGPEVKPDPEVKPEPEGKPDPAPQPEEEKPAADPAPAKAAPVAKPAETALPATGDNGAMAIALGAAGAAAAAAAAGVTAARRRNR